MAESTPPPNTPRSAESESEFPARKRAGRDASSSADGESVSIVGTPTRPDSLPPSTRASSENLSPVSSRAARVSTAPPRSRTSTRPSIPPSEPRPLSRPGIDLRGPERATRIQLTVMLVLGVLLVAIPLYLWRRPRGDNKDAADAGVAAAAADGGALPVAAGGAPSAGDAGTVGGAAISLSEVRIASCQDKGKKKGAEECDRLPLLEQALAKAIQEHGTCLAELLPGESVQFTSDVNFPRKKTGLAARKAGGTGNGRLPKTARHCTEEIRRAYTSVSFADMPHAHQRYRVVVLATFARK